MHGSREDYQVFHRERHAMLENLLDAHVPEKRDHFLDIGGGGDVGSLAKFVREHVAEKIYGVDLEGDVERGVVRGLDSVECDIDKSPLPFPDGFFDVVLFASVIEHLYSPHLVLGEIARTLKPGGILILEAPNAVSLGRRLDAFTGENPFRWFNRYNAFDRGVRMEFCSVFYTAEEIETLLGPKFDILETRYAMHSPPVNFIKRLLRKSSSTLWPRTSDCFAVATRRK
jgi:SAM-dependent methyltransferase